MGSDYEKYAEKKQTIVVLTLQPTPYIEITTMMECQISRIILSYSTV